MNIPANIHGTVLTVSAWDHWTETPTGKDLLTRFPGRACEFLAAFNDGLKAGRHPIPDLKDTFPVVLYFGNDSDREDFIKLVQEAKPGLVARKFGLSDISG